MHQVVEVRHYPYEREGSISGKFPFLRGIAIFFWRLDKERPKENFVDDGRADPIELT